MDNRKRDRITGCFLGVAIGDALGMPVETMKPAAILHVTDGRGINDYLTPIQTRIEDTKNLPAGSTTDDTQLTLAVARSLIARRGFDLVDQARTHVDELAISRFGWGGTTRRAVEDIAKWFRSQEGVGTDRRPAGSTDSSRQARDPELPAPEPSVNEPGGGNGVAMKIAPLALWCFAESGMHEKEPFLTNAMQLGLMTHGDPRASFAAVALGAAIGACVHTDPESNLFSDEHFGFALPHLVGMYVEMIESRYRFFRRNDDSFSRRLNRAWELRGDPLALRREIGTGCFAMESVPFALATFLRQPLNFEEAVLEAVNAGGDTDTTASMVGALCGALVGESGIPKRLIDGLRDAPAIRRYAEVFVDALDLTNRQCLLHRLPRW